MKLLRFYSAIALMQILVVGSLRNESRANVGEAFGFGSRVSSLGGIGVAGNAGAFSAYHNPAELGLVTDKRLNIEWGIMNMQPNFRPITNVITQNKFNSDADATGDVDTSYRSTLGQELGLSYRLFPEAMNFTFGLVTFLPINQVAYMDSGEAYVPEYILYRARTQRPQVDVAVGANLGKGFHLGVGLHFGFTLSSEGSVFINTRPNTISSMRFSSSLKPKAAPFFGVLFSPEESKSYSLGAVLRLPVSSDNNLKLNSAARVFGDFAAVDFNFAATSALYYDPMTLELGGSWQYASWARLFGQLEYQCWNKYQAPALLIQQPQATSTPGGLQISAGKVPSFQYVNIVVPRVGEEISLNDSTRLRMGYAYRPSILSGVANDEGNFLDPPKHMLNFGFGFMYQHFLGFEVPTHLDFNFAYHYLVLQHIVKSSGNEVGSATDSKIGSPGYDAGGNIYGGGVSLSLAF